MQFPLTPEALYPYFLKLVRICIILLIAAVAAVVVQKLIRGLRVRILRIMQRHARTPDIELEKRAATLGGILRKTAAVAIWAVASVMALKEAGFDIAPILATAGVAGLAIGFGAQNLVRDVIAGLFILLENQIRVNDVAVINGTGGLVEEINLRTTVLRGLDGTVHIFPNGTIERLSNMTREYSYYVFDIGVAYKEDTDRVSQVVREIAEEMMQEDPYRDAMLEPIEVLGVDKFADSAVVIKARVKTRPIQQWMVGREMNRRMKKKFDELGIEIPFPHQSLYFGGASQPIKVRMEPLAREEVARIVREVLGEIEQPKPRPAAETDQARRGA